MDRALRQQVWMRADSCCEYCQMPQEFAEPTHQIDHIIAEKHQGETESANLALSCFHCNLHKGPNIAGIDPATKLVTPLFHPRQDNWTEHFRWKGAALEGKTPAGRTTIEVLAINMRDRLLHRQALIEEGVFPSSRDR